MERILLAMDNVKKWAVKIFGKKDADGKTVERLVKRRSRKESSEDLLKNYEQRAKEYDEINKNVYIYKEKNGKLCEYISSFYIEDGKVIKLVAQQVFFN